MKFSGKNGWWDAPDTKENIFIIPLTNITDYGMEDDNLNFLVVP